MGQGYTSGAAIAAIAASHRVGQRRAADALAAGLAGPGRAQGSAVIYDEADLEALIARPACAEEELHRWSPFIARVGAHRRIRVGDPWPVQAQVMSEPWHIPPRVGFVIRRRLEQPIAVPGSGSGVGGRVPMLGTIAGWVVFGAEIMAIEATEGGDQRRQRLLLRPPGHWFDGFRRTWLPVVGTQACTLWGTSLTVGSADSLRVSFAADEAAERDRRAAIITERKTAQAAYLTADGIDSARVPPIRANGRW